MLSITVSTRVQSQWLSECAEVNCLSRLNQPEVKTAQEAKDLAPPRQAGPQMQPHPLHFRELREPTTSSEASSQRVASMTVGPMEACMGHKSPVGTTVQRVETPTR